MTTQGLQHALARMQEQGMSEVALASFSRMYHHWEENHSEWIREDDIQPLTSVPSVAEIKSSIDPEVAHQAFAQTAFLKLNGGLGTSMGMKGPKSLLPVRLHKGRNLRFIDIILGQVVSARQLLKVPLPLLFLNSFNTSAETLQVLRRNRKFKQNDIPVEILQHQEPKIVLSSGEPVDYPQAPQAQWCPPGHGDVFASLWDSGVLDVLLNAGMKYLFISNSDNLGARPSTTIAGYFAQSNSPYLVEVSKKTAADIKGGHFVIDKKTGKLVLREMSQIHPDDKRIATKRKRHPFFNTNNIWVDIEHLRDVLQQYDGVLPLPVIYNRKTVDPTNTESTQIIQLETAMGAAINLFEGASCIEVNRARFLPVKTTNDLLIMRSDRFHMTDTYEMIDGNYIFPDINLDPQYYRYIDDFNMRFPYNVPSLAAASSLTVKGDWTFGDEVRIFGEAILEEPAEPSYVPAGSFVGEKGIEPDNWL